MVLASRVHQVRPEPDRADSYSPAAKGDPVKSTLGERNDVLSSYFRDLQKHPCLDHDATVKLFKKFELGGVEGDKAQKKLIESNLRLVISVARTYARYNLPFIDMIQEGNIGLMKAVKRFQWQRGYRFSTYATWWIRQKIGQYVNKHKRIVRLPAHADVIQRNMDKEQELLRDNGEDVTFDELVDRIKVSKTVARATLHSGRGTVSFDQPMGSGANTSTLADKLADTGDGCDPFNNVSAKQLMQITKRVMDSLTRKESAILRLRFGMVDDATEHDYPITKAEVDGIMQGRGLT